MPLYGTQMMLHQVFNFKVIYLCDSCSRFFVSVFQQSIVDELIKQCRIHPSTGYQLICCVNE